MSSPPLGGSSGYCMNNGVNYFWRVWALKTIFELLGTHRDKELEHKPKMEQFIWLHCLTRTREQAGTDCLRLSKCHGKRLCEPRFIYAHNHQVCANIPECLVQTEAFKLHLYGKKKGIVLLIQHITPVYYMRHPKLPNDCPFNSIFSETQLIKVSIHYRAFRYVCYRKICTTQSRPNQHIWGWTGKISAQFPTSQ